MKNTMPRMIIEGLLDEAAETGAAGVAGEAVRALTLLFAELKPLIGMLAVRALFVRSLHLAHASFERPGTELTSADELLAHFYRDLVSRAPEQAHGAARALLRALVDLLVSLIGEALTNRLLHKAWGQGPVATSAEVKPT